MLGNFFFSSTGEAAYEIEQSLRFDGSSTGLTRSAFGASDNSTTWTLSLWFKRGNDLITHVTQEALVWSEPPGGTTNSGNVELFYDNRYPTRTHRVHSTWSNTTFAFTDGTQRDHSAWYHLVIKCTGTTGTNGTVVYYINGRQAHSSTVPEAYMFGNPRVPRIGSRTAGSYFSGYMAEFHYVHGTAKDATDFGEYDESGVWRPIRYTGSYGTNGFYLKFDPSATNGIGHDHSGNGNNFTPSGFTTSGTGTDVMDDTPTTNWCTWNPLDKDTDVSVSDGNLTASQSSGGIVRGTVGVTSGKWYWETTVNSGTAMIGIANEDSGVTGTWVGINSNGYGYYGGNGNKYNNGATSYGSSYGSGDIIGTALDLDAGSLVFYKNGVSQGTAFTGLSGVFFPAVGNDESPNVTANFGQRAFSYTPPSGFSALNTSNLPAPDIANGDAYFSTYLGPGAGMLDTSSRITADPGSLSNSYYLGSNIDDPGSFNKGGPNANLGNRAIYSTTSSGFKNNGNVGASNTPTYNNGYIEFETALSLSGNCYVYWGNTSAGSGSELGAAIRVTYGDGTTATSQLGKTIDYPEGTWTVGNFSFNKRYIGRYTLNNSKTLKKVEISSSMSGRYDAALQAIVIDDSAEIDLGTLTISVEDGSKFSVGDDVYKSFDSFISGTVTAVSGNDVTIRTSEGFIDDTDRNIDWNENWADAELVHRDSATVITDSDYDFAWIKDRENSASHQLLDKVRGTNKVLKSDSTNSETTYSAPSGSSVGWGWRTGAGSGSSNTNGSITSTVSVNTTAGFSIATFTGNATSGATVGHGLGVQPSMIIIKNRDEALTNWIVGHVGITLGSGRLLLDSTSANDSSNAGVYWNSTAASSTVVTLGNSSSVNRNGDSHVMYCFAEVEGYSKFGEYTGNGSSDGIFIHLGFRPAWFMLKAYSDSGEWLIIDSTRDTYNNTEAVLEAHDPTNESGAEDADMDFLSNGIKFRNTGYFNTNGRDFIYMAFAENPFGGSGVSPATAR